MDQTLRFDKIFQACIFLFCSFKLKLSSEWMHSVMQCILLNGWNIWPWWLMKTQRVVHCPVDIKSVSVVSVFCPGPPVASLVNILVSITHWQWVGGALFCRCCPKILEIVMLSKILQFFIELSLTGAGKGEMSKFDNSQLLSDRKFELASMGL